ncbi:hypothetical protein [Thiolapillus sp.]|uniref:hypothetical protein n=2 Tax=Thiolapillus sp. TaxID=2017437 RepID=UPI0025ED0BBA|nr:hypothetical protein [Thiolapillus sp.]
MSSYPKEMNLFVRSILNEFVNAVVGTILGIVVYYDDADVVSMPLYFFQLQQLFQAANRQ